jgi:tetratricopeptide (TPR) repeat protein
MAQGNPLYAQELVDALHDSGDLCRPREKDDGETWDLSEPMFKSLREADCLAKEDGQWVLAPDARLSTADLGIPDSIHGMVLARIDRLPEPHKLTLKAASVIGRIFEFDLLAGSHPVRPDPETLLEQMKSLRARNFTWLETQQPRLTYMFIHNIIQEVVYQTLLEEQQRELHQAVGEALESLQPEAVERLAFHYRHSDARDKTLLYLDKAARKTQREYANETALNYYSRALALEERWEWRKGQVEVLHILGRRDEEQAALQALGAIPEASVCDVAYLWGQYYEAIGEYPQAQTAVERALEVSQSRGDLVGEVQCLDRLGFITWRQGQYEKAKAWYHQALALLQDEDTQSDEETQVLAQVLNGLGTVHRQQGQFDEARERYEQALELNRTSGNRMGEARTLSNLGVTAWYQRHFDEALTRHQEALEIRQAIGDRAGEGASLYNLALVSYDAGDYSQAQDYCSAALTIHQATGNRWEEVNVWNTLGFLYHELGDLAIAQARLEQGLALSREIGDEAGQAYILANLGQVVRDRGDLEAAERLLNDGLVLAQAQDDRRLVSYFLSYLGSVSLRARRFDQAIERAKATLTIRGESEMRVLTTVDLATLAAAYLGAGDIPQALDYVQQALAILEECEGKGSELPQQDYFTCYRVLSRAGQEETAHSALQAAYDLVVARADRITDAALRQSFLERVSLNREIVREYENVMRDDVVRNA